MSSAWVIEAVDVLEQRGFGLLSGLPCLAPDEFSLDGFEEGFYSGVIITISFATHRDFEPNLTHSFLIFMGAILATAVRVMDATRWRVAQGDGPVQGLQCKIALKAVAYGPTYSPPGLQINHPS